MSTCVVFAALAALAQAPADASRKALEQLRGSWAVAKAEPRFEPVRVVFDGNKATADFGDHKKEGTVTVDPSAKPARIDLLGEKDRESEKILGIYELSGGTLRLCLSAPGGKRPAEFRVGGGAVLVTLTREKK